ncbi:MAG TPA: hypothetical protein VFJ19_09485 [Nocardioidaceae bacterium]|nr:hypothetical protein [Nocardioidaceae bacterium]
MRPQNDTTPAGTEQAVPLDLDAIRARCDAATAGPWVVRADPLDESLWVEVADPGFRSLARGICSNDDPDSDDSESERPDLEFMAHAREDVPALLGEVERLRVVEVASIGAHALLDDAEQAIDRVRALHAPWEVNDEQDGHVTPVCRHCCTDPWGDQTEECVDGHDHSDGRRCATLRALDAVAGHDGPEVTR